MQWFPTLCHAGPSSLVFFWGMLNSLRWWFTDCSVRRIKKTNVQSLCYWVHIRVLWSSFLLHWKPNILSVNYDSWWQHQMSVREIRHDRPSGWFSKSRGLSASVSFLSSPPPPRSFTHAIFARSLTLVPRSLLLNRTETLATQANFKTAILILHNFFVFYYDYRCLETLY